MGRLRWRCPAQRENALLQFGQPFDLGEYVDFLGISKGMRNQTSEAFANIEREHNDVKGRVELQRHVVAQHMVETDAGEAGAAALLDDEASKLRILDYLRKWLGDKLEEKQANRTERQVDSGFWRDRIPLEAGGVTGEYPPLDHRSEYSRCG